MQTAKQLRAYVRMYVWGVVCVCQSEGGRAPTTAMQRTISCVEDRGRGVKGKCFAEWVEREAARKLKRHQSIVYIAPGMNEKNRGIIVLEMGLRKKKLVAGEGEEGGGTRQDTKDGTGCLP